MDIKPNINKLDDPGRILAVILFFIEKQPISKAFFKSRRTLDELLSQYKHNLYLGLEITRVLTEHSMKISLENKEVKEQGFIDEIHEKLLFLQGYMDYSLGVIDTVDNSNSFYEKKIGELNHQEKLLREEISDNSKTNKSPQSSEENKRLIEITQQLAETERKLKQKQKNEDVKSEWENKIKDTFSQLKEYLDPIKREYRRLNVLYYTFALLSILTIIIIFTVEIFAMFKLVEAATFPNFERYLILFLPIPIAGVLMWGFVFQMNRAQRQLVLIANNIHSIDYIQGLLISINNLSQNTNDGISRINAALDKVIFNHLNANPATSEVDFLAEEKKDEGANLDLDKLATLIKTIKETTK